MMLNLQAIATATGLTLTECREYRADYLRGHIKELTADALWLAEDTCELSPSFCQNVLEQMYLEERELHHLVLLAKGFQPSAGIVTNDMIERARGYPIEQIIQFDQHGQSVAFCHADKRPSLTWYKAKNRATCFPCGKSYNPIDVLIQRDGHSFREAVKLLTT